MYTATIHGHRPDGGRRLKDVGRKHDALTVSLAGERHGIELEARDGVIHLTMDGGHYGGTERTTLGHVVLTDGEPVFVQGKALLNSP